MAPKRKSDVLEPVFDLTTKQPEKENDTVIASTSAGSATKKARVLDAGDASSSSSGKKGKAAAASAPKDWREVVLEGEDEVSVYKYASCRVPHGLNCCVFHRVKCTSSESSMQSSRAHNAVNAEFMPIVTTVTRSAGRFVFCRRSLISRCVRTCFVSVWLLTMNMPRTYV